MSEKFGTDFSEDQFEPVYRAQDDREYDLRVRMFALDMAVIALPTLVSSVDTEESKLRIIRRAVDEFEAILKGEV